MAHYALLVAERVVVPVDLGGIEDTVIVRVGVFTVVVAHQQHGDVRPLLVESFVKAVSNSFCNLNSHRGNLYSIWRFSQCCIRKE